MLTDLDAPISNLMANRATPAPIFMSLPDSEATERLRSPPIDVDMEDAAGDDGRATEEAIDLEEGDAPPEIDDYEIYTISSGASLLAHYFRRSI